MSELVSIVIPVFNVAPYLCQCLNSTGAFGREDREVILVNDGSNDGSENICRNYADKWDNVRLIEKPNGGLSDARNEGVKVARGKYIFFLDSDDWLIPGAIDVLYNFAEETSCGIVQGGFYYAYEDHWELDDRSISVKKPPFILECNDAMRELIKNDYIKNFAWGKLYRSDIVNKHQFPLGKCFEDSFWQHLIVAECECYGVIPQPLYCYRQRSDSISGNLGLKSLDFLAGNEERLYFIEKVYPEYVTLMADKLWKYAFICTRYSDRKEFRDALNRISVQFFPLFSKKLKCSIIYRFSKYESKFIRKPFLFMLRVYEFFTVKRLKTISFN